MVKKTKKKTHKPTRSKSHRKLRRNKTRHNKTRRNKTRRNKTRHNKTRRNKTQRNKTRYYLGRGTKEENLNSLNRIRRTNGLLPLDSLNDYINIKEYDILNILCINLTPNLLDLRANPITKKNIQTYKRTYKKLSLAMHPDKLKSEDKEEHGQSRDAFNKMQGAWERFNYLLQRGTLDLYLRELITPGNQRNKDRIMTARLYALDQSKDRLEQAEIITNQRRADQQEEEQKHNEHDMKQEKQQRQREEQQRQREEQQRQRKEQQRRHREEQQRRREEHRRREEQRRQQEEQRRREEHRRQQEEQRRREEQRRQQEEQQERERVEAERQRLDQIRMKQQRKEIDDYHNTNVPRQWQHRTEAAESDSDSSDDDMPIGIMRSKKYWDDNKRKPQQQQQRQRQPPQHQQTHHASQNARSRPPFDFMPRRDPPTTTRPRTASQTGDPWAPAPSYNDLFSNYR
jgi:hypothetical protein